MEQHQPGSLTVVGTGIKFAGHITVEAQAFIEQADKLFFGVNDPLLAQWLQQRNETAESLTHLYAQGKLRRDTYQEMVAVIMAAVRQGQQVCVAFYGHPGVFVSASHEAIRQARAEGYSAYILPAVSAEDCLFADLGVDPAQVGCQSYEATEFLLHGRQPDNSAALILWQIGVVGNLYKTAQPGNKRGLTLLLQRLIPVYGEDCVVTVYEAAQYPAFPPRIDKVPLGQLATVTLRPISTLYIPAQHPLAWDEGVMVQLGIGWEDVTWVVQGDSLPK